MKKRKSARKVSQTCAVYNNGSLIARNYKFSSTLQSFHLRPMVAKNTTDRLNWCYTDKKISRRRRAVTSEKTILQL